MSRRAIFCSQFLLSVPSITFYQKVEKLPETCTSLKTATQTSVFKRDNHQLREYCVLESYNINRQK